ncbi:19511_t:CDS:1 [Funneliformis geosporum]|uniref:18498_t:CDS:1 n=1 Tax=Funneliformis geosporum TaxID=1117311 RepID=A0A9W4SCM4_9GLOM|nr:19511_t:CDS:1 [Funneliformis geosporum]CAI2164827.1 18498_t:CDS:1 [Funneliformis geosporum]
MANLLKGPAHSLYKEFTPSAYFSYQLGRNSFQQGYLGITSNVSIIGLLHLRFPAHRPLYAKQIQICFLGTEFVQAQCSGPKFSVLNTNTICEVTIELWKSSDDEYQEILDMDLPFEIPIPLDIPSSMSVVKGQGKVEYCLRAIISKKSNLRGTKKIIQCAYTVSRYALPPLPKLKKWIKRDPTKRIGYEINLNNKVFGPRNPIVVRLKLTFYDSRVSLENFIVGLKEYIVIAGTFDIKKKSKYMSMTILNGRQLPMTTESQYNECIADIKLSIPEDCSSKLTWSHESFNIKVTHKLKIKVKFGFFSKYNFSLDVPVKIVNMLSVEEEAYLAAELLYQQENSINSEPGTQPNFPPPNYEQDWLTSQTSLPPYS